MKRLRSSPAPPFPLIHVFNSQRALRIDVALLAVFAQEALRTCCRIPGRVGGLRAFQELSTVLVSDRRMAELHWRFLRVRGPTDVLTFEHGEIVISTETARRNAARFHTSADHEIRLYLIHGLLHLHGFDDRTAAPARLMKKAQTRILVTLSKSH